MRIAYEPENVQFWTHVLLQVGSQHGGNIDGYAGRPFQRGSGLGSLFSGLFRMALPILKSAGRAVGKQALASGSTLLQDLASGQEPRMVFKRRGREAIGTLLSKAGDAVRQDGNGLGILIRKRTRRPPKVDKRRKGIAKKTKHWHKKSIFDSI
jgi:hypothetical protein